MPLPQPRAERRRPLRAGDFPDWTSYYRAYQGALTREVLLPLLRQWGIWKQGLRILDVGCGDGGSSAVLAREGASVEGIDLEVRRVTAAAEWVRAQGLDVRLHVGDITTPDTLTPLNPPYDLILFRDVLEHIPDVDAALAESRLRLADGGAILVVYPPYFSAYGGHQQILHPPRRLGLPLARLPFIHLLPCSWWRAAQRRPQGEDDPQWEEILTIRRARLTIGGLHRRARRQGLRRVRARHYLLRPSFRLRYGTPVWGAGLLGSLPGLRELLVTGAWELFRPES